MEFKKGSEGFTLEFNTEEENNFKRLVQDLKKHDDFSSLTSESEFLALIINEGVASLQHKTNPSNDHHELESLFYFPEYLVEALNDSLYKILQPNEGHLTDEKEFPVSIESLLSLMPDLNSLSNEPVSSFEKNESPTSFDEPPTLISNNGTEDSSQNIDETR